MELAKNKITKNINLNTIDFFKAKGSYYFYAVQNEIQKGKPTNSSFIIFLKKNAILVNQIDTNDYSIKNSFSNQISYNFLNIVEATAILFNERIYVLLNSVEKLEMYIVDIKEKETYPLVDCYDNFDLLKNYAFTFNDDLKILFTGGISKNYSMNKDVLFFDVSTFQFGKENIKENNFIPRHRHGTIHICGYLYVIGGFKTLEENDDEICNGINSIKYTNLMISWVEHICLGDKPINLIDPICYLYDLKYLICVSMYKGFNCFILNLPTATGKNIDLVKENLFGSLQFSKRHFGILNLGSKVMVSNHDEEKKSLDNTILDLDCCIK